MKVYSEDICIRFHKTYGILRVQHTTKKKKQPIRSASRLSMETVSPQEKIRSLMRLHMMSMEMRVP
nr:hypothetical protein [uncultured Anaerostipes sp.]